MRIVAVAALATILMIAPAWADQSFISDAWIRATPPGVSTAAGYMKVHNEGPALKLVTVSCDAAGEVQLHQHIMEDGLMRMEQLPEITVDTNTVLEFKPGSLHLMLRRLKQPLAAGDSVACTVRFDDGSVIEQQFSVRAPGSSGNAR